MATYDASPIKSGDTLNLGTLITHLQTLPAAGDTNSYTAGVLSSASSTPVTAVTQTVAVSTDDIVLILASYNYSVSDGSSSLFTRLVVDSSNIGNDAIHYSDISSSDGMRGSSMRAAWIENESGSIAFDLKFARNNGAGTVYIGNSEIWILTFKKKA